MAARYDCDVVVVGAGPGGSMAARYAAEGGAKTILIEKKAEIGAPLRCAEGVSKKWLAELGIEADPAWARADMAGAIIRSPSGITAAPAARANASSGFRPFFSSCAIVLPATSLPSRLYTLVSPSLCSMTTSVPRSTLAVMAFTVPL